MDAPSRIHKDAHSLSVFIFFFFLILIAARVADRPLTMDRMQISLLVVRIMDIDGFSFHHEDIKGRRIQKSSSAMACCTAAALTCYIFTIGTPIHL